MRGWVVPALIGYVVGSFVGLGTILRVVGGGAKASGSY